MNYKKYLYRWIPLIILSISIGILPSYAAKRHPRQSKVFGPPGNFRLNPYLFNGFSRKNIYKSRSGSSYGYSLLNAASATNDTVKIIALRVEFQLDSSFLTTGNGLFGIYRNNKGTTEDVAEKKYYTTGAYKYDNLFHDSTYFAQHLEFVKKYYWKVSNGHLHVEYEIFPPGPDEKHAYKVPDKMTKYSPGAKMKKESWDEYYYRRTVGLMEFVRDAIRGADSAATSPFRKLSMEPDGLLYEIDTVNTQVTKRKVAILLIHAGASYLTDGGWDGYFGQDTPSDMIDAFISNEFFDYFATVDSTLGFDTDSTGKSGVWVNKSGTNRFILDELMMVSETSNQDSLNWGINGILVNQLARQIGIPDLFSTMSGISGIGAFCIMDFAGYSTGRGFVPPWPSAWVRAYMGWDTPVVIEPGNTNINGTVTAISAAQPGDTTILLIPINNHEFYLIENRQRNLTGDTTFFNHDIVEDIDPSINGSSIIDPYDHVNIDKNIATFTNSSVIDSIINSDISIPASGILIWHVDEHIIRDHLEHNIVNADSSYRGISLEEADGVVDLGVMFQDVFYQAAFDYGGAADVFPHYTSENGTAVNTIGPFTRPSTQSNDGGHTYLTIAIAPRNNTGTKEVSIVEGMLVYNFVDSVFQITVGRKTDCITSFTHWPQRIVPDKFFEPVLCDIYPNGDTLECVVVDTSGRVYVWSAYGNDSLYTSVKEAIPSLLYSNDTVYTDTISYCDIIPQPAGMPTCVDSSSLYIPSRDSSIYILRSIDSDTAIWDRIDLNHPASSYVCNYSGTKWAVGCADGMILYGDDASSSVTSLSTTSSGSIQALAVIDTSNGILAAISDQGVLTVCSPSGLLDSATLYKISKAGIYPPYTLVTADLDQNGIIDIVVSDRKQGLWLYHYNSATNALYYSAEWIKWEDGPNDWAGSHRLDTNRASIPDNESAPSIADLDNDQALDIIVGGTNGMYAYNHRGILLINWPSLLDTHYWLQRGSITSSPVIGFAQNSIDPLVLFSAPTGENVTIGVAHIDSVNDNTGTIYYTFSDGLSDSIPGLNKSLIDSLLVFGDSLVLPYVTPGGFIDAVTMHGKRPTTINTLSNVGKVIQSNWPLSVGGSIRTSPLLCDIDNNNKADIIAVTDAGMVYRWEMANSVISTSYVWPQAGANSARTFTYSGPLSTIAFGLKSEIVHFYNYSNPAKRIDTSIPFNTTFKYQLTKPARSVRLDIFTYTGHHIVSERSLPSGYGWNEYIISLEKFGSAVYRCRLEADFSGKKKVKYWKMAVMK